jgi:hypothetical protein
MTIAMIGRLMKKVEIIQFVLSLPRSLSEKELCAFSAEVAQRKIMYPTDSGAG